MPQYLPPRKGTRLSQAYAEAATHAPVMRAMLRCYELWHPTLDEPVRIVNDFEPLVAVLESSAPRNPSQQVEFVAAVVTAARPEESDEAATPTIDITLDNVAGLMTAALDRARGSTAEWQFIERVYASDDLSGPAVVPVLVLTFSSVVMAGGAAKLKASFGDPVNAPVPRLTFTPEEYPGLTAR